MKKNISSKLIIFLIIVLSVFTLFITPSFATDTITITGIDNNNYTLPSFPSGVTEHKYYLLTYHRVSAMVKEVQEYTLYVFDKTINISGDYIYFDRDSSDVVKCYTCDIYHGETSWTETVALCFQHASYDYVIDCSSNLLKYKDSLLNVEDGFFLTVPTASGTLAPIVQETSLEGVLQEIVEILPIVLVIIVGLIGLRKALAMLSKVLHQS